MLRQLTQPYLRRFRRRFIASSTATSTLVMAVLGFVLILMPVSFKAGTDTVHPHSVFQAIVDQARETTHRHSGHSVSDVVDRPGATQPTLFLALDVPLSMYAVMTSPAAAIDAMVRTHHLTHVDGVKKSAADPDIPDITSLHGSSDLASALPLLAAILAIFFLMQPVRRIWFPERLLRGIQQIVDGPPPRVLPV